MAKADGRLFEQKLASLVGGSVVKGSGNQWDKKGDVTTENLLIQAKATNSSQFILKLDDLKKADREASAVKKCMAFVINFEKEDKSFILVDMEDI